MPYFETELSSPPQLDLSLLNELHQNRRRKRLSQRSEVVGSMFGGWNPILNICIAETLRLNHFLIFHDDGEVSRASAIVVDFRAVFPSGQSV